MALGDEVRKMILDRAQEIRAGCLRADIARTGTLSIADFRKVLYFEGALPYSAVQAAVANAAPAGPAQHRGHVAYDLWFHSFLQPMDNDSVAAPAAIEMRRNAGLGCAPDQALAAVMDDIRHVVAGNFDKLMRAFVLHDGHGTGMLPAPEFQRVLHLQLGIPGSHIDAVFAAAGIDTTAGFIEYSEWTRFVASSSSTSPQQLTRFFKPAHDVPGAEYGNLNGAEAMIAAHELQLRSRPDYIGEEVDAEMAHMRGGLANAQHQMQLDAQAQQAIAIREEHVAHEQRVAILQNQLGAMDECARDIAFERHLYDTQTAEEDRLLRLSIEKEEEHALLRNALKEPPSSAKFTKELLAEKKVRELTPAQSARLVDELLEIHVASPTRAMGFVQRMPLDPHTKLDLFRDLRSSVDTKEDRFIRDLRILEYLENANPDGNLGPKQEAELIDKIRRTTCSAAKKVEVLREMPIDQGKKLELLHELRLYNVIDEGIAQGRHLNQVGNPTYGRSLAIGS